ncbi:MAG: membrane protease YdiL (CAAX protease family) [Myxococcota bacterium]|jgi:membrane protease YdiL (CAAX protease family)
MESLIRLWTLAMGNLPEWPEPDRDNRLLMMVGLFACAALYLANEHPARGGPMFYGVWRMVMFGGIPLLGLSIWSAAARGGSRLGAAGVGLLLSIPVSMRLLEGPEVFKVTPTLFLPGLIAMVLALFVVSRSEETLESWGLTLGDWRWWAPRTAVFGGLVLVGVAAAMTVSEDLASFYPAYKPAQTDFAMLLRKQLGLGLDFVGWELLFRGFLLFGIARRGDAWVAIWLQCIPFFLLHSEKPELELLLSLPGGLIAGWFSLRSRSFVPLLLLHCLQMWAVNFIGFAMRA